MLLLGTPVVPGGQLATLTMCFVRFQLDFRWSVPDEPHTVRHAAQVPAEAGDGAVDAADYTEIVRSVLAGLGLSSVNGTGP
jgi:hypothetical protein